MTLQTFACPHCDKVFARTFTLTRHINAAHNMREYPCSKCGKSYTRPDTLREHYLKCTPQAPPPAPKVDKDEADRLARAAVDEVEREKEKNREIGVFV